MEELVVTYTGQLPPWKPSGLVSFERYGRNISNFSDVLQEESIFANAKRKKGIGEVLEWLYFALYFVVRRMCFDGFGFTIIITDWSTILYDNLIKSRKKKSFVRGKTQIR